MEVIKAEFSKDIKYWSNIIYGGVSGTVFMTPKTKEVYQNINRE